MTGWSKRKSERVLTELLTGHAGEPVTGGDSTTVDGTECGYLRRVFFQTKPLVWEVSFVEVIFTDAEQQPVTLRWVEEEQSEP